MSAKPNKKLIKAIKDSWTPETSGATDWDYDDWIDAVNYKSTGQCVVTSLLIQELFGGDLLYSDNPYHVWNKLPDGTELDLTVDQFGPDFEGCSKPVIMQREYALKDQNREPRYNMLKESVLEKL